MDTLTGQVYLQSRTTLTAESQDSETDVSEDSLLVSSTAVIATADSISNTSDVKVEASDTVTPSIASLLTEVAVVALSLAAACFIIVWYIKRK